MTALVVLAKPLAMVRQDDQQRVLAVAGRAQRLQHAPELRVGERDLAVVRPIREALLERRRRRVGRVRVVEMDPREERGGRIGEPGYGGLPVRR